MPDKYDTFCCNGKCKHERRQHSRCGCGEENCSCKKTYMQVGQEARAKKDKRTDRG